MRLVDFALLPAHRDGGLGFALIQTLLAEAARAGQPVRLLVAKLNRAVRLNERLGFARIGDTGTHLDMEWVADSAGAPGI
jgi:ribosomal protein S18 acetylase RimI-like enzyme